MFSTKDVSTGGKRGPIISTGNQKLKINSIEFKPTPEAYNILLHVESEPIGGEFQGFLVDKNNPNGPRYQGQVGRIRMSPYHYKDATLPNGRTISRDNEMVKAIAFLGDATGLRSEVDEIQANTIEQFMAACQNIFKNTEYINACVGGREWMNQDGYINVDMHLPRLSKDGVPLERLDVENPRILTFDADKHVRKHVSKNTPVENNSSSDFSSNDDFAGFSL
ncbi:MAG: hypothetical protein HRT87_06760 [Legionellales bacterium]|nr:hypothetical protein [Legionellales bacterium]